MTAPLLIDAHLDLAMNALCYNRDLTLGLEELRARERHMTDDPGARGKATVTFGEMRRAGVAVCVGTIIARSGPRFVMAESYNRRELDFASPAIAAAAAWGQVAWYRQMEAEGHLRLLRTAAELDAHVQAWRDGRETQRIGVVLSMEGTDPIVKVSDATAWREAGLRLAGLAHYGESRHAGGTGTTVGLSAEGRALLAALGELNIGIDVTHLSDEAMAEVFDLHDGPTLASHSNCRALADHQRQLSDEQVRRIVQRDGVVGVVTYARMIDAGWKYEEPTDGITLERWSDHIDHVCQLAGDAEHVALGSDLDGGYGYEATPGAIRSIADLPKLADTLSARGYGDADIAAIFHGNWLRLLRRVMAEKKGD